jgi:hypothetical protein
VQKLPNIIQEYYDKNGKHSFTLKLKKKKAASKHERVKPTQ